jgi:putative hemolysin
MSIALPVYCLVFLLVGMVFNTLLDAYIITGSAGIRRLREKYPDQGTLIDESEAHWPRLQGILMFFSVCAQLISASNATLTLLALHEANWGWALAALLLYLALYVICIKIIPYAVSEGYADRISVRSLPFTRLLARTGFVFSMPIASIERGLLKWFTDGTEDEDRPTAEEEILSLVNQTDEIELEEAEREIIQNVFEFGDTVAREIMTPRIDLVAIEHEKTINEAVIQVKDSPYSRFPVFMEKIDHVVGIMHVKDLLRAMSDECGEQNIRTIEKPPLFVTESMPINDMLEQFQRQHTQVGIVVDEYGGTAGLVTIEDIIEELVGEIEDEHDPQANRYQHLADGSTLIDARLAVDEANEILEIAIPEGEEYDSVAGYLLYKLGRIPRSGETIEENAYLITVQTASERQLHKLRIFKK